MTIAWDSHDPAVQFISFAETEAAHAPFYGRLARAIADEPDLCELLLVAEPRQRRAVLFFAGLHDLLLRHPGSDLAHYYPGLAPGAVREGDPIPALRAFCMEHRAELETIYRSRRTQTNEVGRSALLVPAFAEVERRTGQPLALIEVGPSAGLNLIFDRYGYDYGAMKLGDAASGVRLCPVIAGDSPRLPARLPEVASRTGIDLDPVDVRDDEAARWLQACMWPEQPERVARLRAAIAIARGDPPTLLRGDTLDLLPAAIAAAPPGATVTVFHSMVMTYFQRAYRAAFVDLLLEASHARPVAWVTLEAPGVVPGIEPPPLEEGASAERQFAPLITLSLLEGGSRSDTILHRAHPHGAWLEWLDTH